MHQGNEPLLVDIRKLWNQALIVNRPGRGRDEIGSDVASGLADVESYGQMTPANPDFVERLKAEAPMNDADQGPSSVARRKGTRTIQHSRNRD